LLQWAVSVPEYNEILTELLNRARSGVEDVERELAGRTVTVDHYRELVARRFYLLTEDYVSSLPKERKHGAAVTLQDYGLRNREEMVQRMRTGAYDEVEVTYARRKILESGNV